MYLPGGTMENQTESESGKPVAWPRFNPVSSEFKSRTYLYLNLLDFNNNPR
jgi:hypothetical protein